MPIAKRMPLPRAWIDRIFARMFGIYGNSWTSKWATGEELGDGRDLGVEAAKEVWAQELGGFSEHPERIAFALQACRDLPRPPDLPAFRALCVQAQPATPPALPAPVADPVVAADAQRRIVSALELRGERDPLSWAKNPRSRVAMETAVRGALAGHYELVAIVCEHAKAGHEWLSPEGQAFATRVAEREAMLSNREPGCDDE